MFSIKDFSEKWNTFFHSETDGSSLCLYRILIGFLLCLSGLSLIPDYEQWFYVGSESLVPLGDSFSFYSNFRINIFKIIPPTDLSAWIVLFMFVASSITLCLGFKTRVSSIVCFILLVSLQNRNHAILNSGDTVLRCMLFILMFAPCGRMFSLDSIFNRELCSKKQISILPIRLLQIQLAVVYLSTALYKMKGIDWIDGTAVYYTSRLLNFQRFELPFLFDTVLFIKGLTWTTLFIEFAMGSLVWIKEFRLYVLMAGLLLHLGIELTMSIGLFEWIMISSYVLFLEPNEINKIGLFFKSLFSRKLQRV